MTQDFTVEYNPIMTGNHILYKKTASGAERWIVYYTYAEPFTGKNKQWKIYQIRWRERWIPLASKEMSKDLLIIINKEIEDGSHNPWHYQRKSGSILSFKEQANIYLEYTKEKEKKKLIKHIQVKDITRAFEEYFIPHFGDKEVGVIKRFDIEMLMSKTLPSSWEPKTLKNNITFLKTFFKRLYELDVIQKAPNFPELGKIPKPAVRYIEPEQVLKIISHVPEKHRPIYIVGTAHGMRPGEVRALQVRDVKLNTGKYGSITIQRAYSRNVLYETPKDKESRVIPINPVTWEVIEAAMQDKLPDAFLFMDGTLPYSEKRLYGIWMDACGVAKIRIDVRRAMRTSWTMQMVKSKVPIQVVSKALGHSSEAVTRHYYDMDSELIGDNMYENNLVPIKKDFRGEKI